MSTLRWTTGSVTAAIAMTLFVGPANAQRGFGGGGGGNDLVSVVATAEVAKILKLNDEQSKQIKELLASYQKKNRELFEEMRGASEDDRREIFNDIRENRETTENKVKEIVKGDALKRAEQIRLQAYGAGSAIGFFGPPSPTAEALGLSEDQINDARERLREVFEETRSQFEDAGDDEDKIAQVRAATTAKRHDVVAEMFSDDQKAKWKELIGEPLSDDQVKAIRVAVAKLNPIPRPPRN
jgi:hypothetical protein